MAREQPALHFLYREMDALSHDLDKDAVRRQLIKMRTTPRSVVAALRMPLLCITGRGGRRHPAGGRRGPRRARPRARGSRGVPEAGHSVYWERAETFNRLVDEFLAGAS